MAIAELSINKTRAISWRRYYDLTKPKVVTLILFTTLVGIIPERRPGPGRWFPVSCHTPVVQR